MVYISYNTGTRALPDIYALALGRCVPLGIVHIYQAKHSCLCYNLYTHTYIYIYIYIYTFLLLCHFGGQIFIAHLMRLMLMEVYSYYAINKAKDL